MVIAIKDPVTREKCKSASISKLLIGVREVQAIYLQQQLKGASTDATVLAVIAVAEGLGFNSLAEEMKEHIKSNNSL